MRAVSDVMKLGVVSILLLFIVNCSAIRCYHCHSHLNEVCADPFGDEAGDEQAMGGNETMISVETNSELASLLVDCNTLGGDKSYTFCRKTVQIATSRPHETTRVIRSCGFLEEPKLALKEGDNPVDLKCYRRTGTFGVELIYCACYADGCNKATITPAGFGIVLLMLTVSMLITSISHLEEVF